MEYKTMNIETAMEYLADLNNVYLDFIPVSKDTKKNMKLALYLATGALKTIDDMKTKGASIYGQATKRTSLIDSEKP